LNRLAQQKRAEQDAEKQVQRTQEQVNQYILGNAKAEFENLLNVLERRVSEVNPDLRDLPRFEFGRGGPGPHMQQGNVAAYLLFYQPMLNTGPIIVRLSFGREPGGVYLDIFDSPPPEPERYEIHPAMEISPDRIIWTGDLGEISTEQLAEFVLSHLTEYYLDHKPGP
jgi:hypothetical protein